MKRMDGQEERIAAYERCTLCPRACGAARNDGQSGICGVDAELYVARAALHFWEEPCISGSEGSGAVFFSGCSLKCVFCQNYALSRGGRGKRIGIPRLTEIFFELEEQGANNINLVTPDHYIPSIAQAMRDARERGLRIPFVINCSGYETTEQLCSLSGLADIYLMDFKYMDAEKARRYSAAPDYPERAKEALREMLRQAPEPILDAAGKMQRGVIVRHLLMPGMVRNAEAVVDYVYESYGEQVYLSLMQQFTPLPRLTEYPELCRRVSRREYARLVDHALSLGIERAFIQERGTAEESFIPLWNQEGV